MPSLLLAFFRTNHVICTYAATFYFYKLGMVSVLHPTLVKRTDPVLKAPTQGGIF
jgi:hypothetical protein